MNETKPYSSKETMVMPPRLRGERRQTARSALAAPYPAFFTWQGRHYVARLHGVSRGGASLIVETDTADFTLQSDVVLAIVIQTPWEKVIRKGRVAWSGQVN